jgi:hypothetical protein
VPDPFASREDLLKILLMDFGVASVEDVTSGRLRDASRTELSYLLYEFLGTLAPLQAFAVVFIDEAQNLSVPLLEETRILSDADGQLQVVLVGQLELRDKLKLPEMRQLKQRVSVHRHLSPLDLVGVAGYIAHRLRQAGGTPDRITFSGDASEVIYEMSGGIPRIINRLCDRALQTGYTRRAATIDHRIVEEANPEEVAAQPVSPSPEPPRAVAATNAPATVVLPPVPIAEPVVTDAAPAPAPRADVAAPVPPIPAHVEPPAPAPRPAPEPPARAAAPPPPAPGRTRASLPDHLEYWFTEVEKEPQAEPVRSNWRRRWAPTNAVSAEPEQRSGLIHRVRSVSLLTRVFAGVAAGFILVLAALVYGPSVGAAIQERITPPAMPSAPEGPRLRQPPPLQLPAPPGPADPQ